jgi:hypothetical protein
VGETNIVSSSQTPATNFLPPQPILALAKRTKATCDNPAVGQKEISTIDHINIIT